MINIKQILGLTYYTSELDQFLADFDKTHPKLSASQRKEKEKYARIYRLRDNPVAQEGKEFSLWDNF
ncbi:MAG: hypothetical protein EPO11_02860 [Gammaproteobacteria bacterium]|nr:MAG: hypothetical protein EPO11_02860 [Gammaproteobacteria bacterium]